MSKPCDTPGSLLHRIGVAGLARLRAFKGTSARIAALLTIVAATAAFSATPALAVSIHAFSKSFGEKGSAAGQLELASSSGVAVNNTTHDVYVADTHNRRVDEFNDEGDFVLMFGKEVNKTKVLGGLATEEEQNVCTEVEVALGAECQQGTAGSAPGEFEAPTLVAVDNAPGGEGDVYVADTGTELVQKFTAAGALVKSWGVEGQLKEVPGPAGTAALTAGSNVITFINGEGLLDFYEGEEILGAGIPAGTHIVDCRSNSVCELSNPATVTGTGVAITAPPVDLGTLSGIAVGATTGDLWLYAQDPTPQVLEFERGGGFVKHWFLRDDNEPGHEAPPSGVAGDLEVTAGANAAFDQATSELYVDRGASIEDLGPTGGVIDVFGPPQLSGGAGLAVDSGIQPPTGGTVYAANTSTDQLDAYGLALQVNTGATSEVTATAATLDGGVNPEGSPVPECKFEYVTISRYEETGNYEHTVPCEHPDAAEIGDGTGSVPVHAKIAGLLGGTTYRFRLLAEHENVMTHETKTAAGEGEVFPTSPIPVIAGGEAVDVTAGGAELRATVNPEGLQVSHCAFEYGTSTSYGLLVRCAQKKSVIGAGTEPVPVSAQLAELAPNTTYYWRLSVKDANGEGYEPGHTFVYPTTGAELPENRLSKGDRR